MYNKSDSHINAYGRILMEVFLLVHPRVKFKCPSHNSNGKWTCNLMAQTRYIAIHLGLVHNLSSALIAASFHIHSLVQNGMVI